MGKVGGLWKSTDKNGNSYLSGSIDVYGKIKIFKNSYKTEEKHPDYVIYDTREKTEKKDGGTNFNDFDDAF